MIKARVTVTLKQGVLDPQGKAIEHALDSLGFAGVGSVRQGKVFDIELEGADRAQAEADIKAMCDRLLANTVIENYSISLPEIGKEYFLLEEKHDVYFDQLVSSNFGTVREASSQKPLTGVYALYDSGEPLYVGRTNKRGLGPRMRNHLTRSHQQAVLAFKLARLHLGIKTAYSGLNTRGELMKRSEFVTVFEEQIRFVSALKVRFVEIVDADDQYIFEYYASKRLKTPHNDFNTH